MEPLLVAYHDFHASRRADMALGHVKGIELLGGPAIRVQHHCALGLDWDASQVIAAWQAVLLHRAVLLHWGRSPQ